MKLASKTKLSVWIKTFLSKKDIALKIWVKFCNIVNRNHLLLSTVYYHLLHTLLNQLVFNHSEK